MSFNMKIKLPTPKEIIAQYPVPEEVAKHKAECDAELIDVLDVYKRQALINI